MRVVVHGIPTCGTCKKARKWLDRKGIGYEWVDLREKAPSKTRITKWRRTFGAKAMRNTSGGSYRALGAKRDAFTEKDWEAAFAKDAMLLKRPVLEVDGEPAAVGFKQEEWEQRLG
jgi:arsenate reductase